MKKSAADVLELLRARGPIGVTSLAALEHCGTLRLAARIDDLRALGFDIETVMENGPTGKRWARYVLHERPVVVTGTQMPLLDSLSGDTATASPRVVVSPLRSPRGALLVGSRAG